MTVEQVLEILRTREAVAREVGNTTELSLIYELVKIAENYKELLEENN